MNPQDANLISRYSSYGMSALIRGEQFWRELSAPPNQQELLRFSALMGILPLSGYLFSYAIVGRVWNVWPWIQTTLPVSRAVMCAGLQWVFFATFPMLSSLLLKVLFSRWNHLSEEACTLITTYSMTPVYMVALFVGVPFIGRILIVLGFSTFVYLLYYGYRIRLGQTILRSAMMTLAAVTLFALIRQMFIFVIGF